MTLKLSTTKTFTLVAGILAGVALSAPAAEAGMRIYFGFPVGGFYVGGGHHHYRAHKYHAWRYHDLRRARAIEAERARKAAIAAERAEQKRLAALAVAKRKAADARADAGAKEPEAAEITLAAIPLPVKKPDNPNASEAGTLTTAAITTAANSAPFGEEPKKLECKRYFANVGLTITVPCTE
ncbi:MAG TPA: hypothetical protein VFX46_08885 [Hyphomicrobiaceae bacterium]|nr:hypothetical protein [Hyphomicrobiaceae bacterium]